MMNRKLIALFLAVSTISTSMFALLGDIVEGTFDTAGRVATVPVDAVDTTFDRDTTWDQRRRERAEDRRERREERRDARRERRLSNYDY